MYEQIRSEELVGTSPYPHPPAEPPVTPRTPRTARQTRSQSRAGVEESLRPVDIGTAVEVVEHGKPCANVEESTCSANYDTAGRVASASVEESSHPVDSHSTDHTAHRGQSQKRSSPTAVHSVEEEEAASVFEADMKNQMAAAASASKCMRSANLEVLPVLRMSLALSG